ncbi:MAG: hypothetical protein QOG13_848 [Sphingomonadales bacterium]|jgi:hypothetical protein|nr:hypothetical protein [Sphingomonadales bacterium]
MKRILIAGALAVLSALPSCADARAGELACQRRLVETGPAADFAQIGRRYAQMPLDGCNEGQRHAARRLAEVAGRLAPALARARAAYPQGGASSLRDNESFMALQSLIEEYEGRRRALREDLERMTAAKR